MKLYLIHFDGDGDYVEAPDLGTAVRLWREQMQRENPEELWVDEPESIQLVHEKDVIR